MTPDQLKTSILQRIDEHQLAPKPHWQFALRNGGMWALGVVAVGIGGVAMAVVMHLLVSSDLDLLLRGGGNPVADALRMLPYFWLVLLVLFVLLARYQVTHTKRGYRYSMPTVVGVLIGTSLLLGLLFSATGLGRLIDQAFERRLPLYGDLLSPRHALWCASEGDRLGGMVLEVMDHEHFCLIDIQGNAWIVNLSEVPETTKQLAPQTVVRLLGQANNEGVFQATTMRVKQSETPFGPPDRFEVGVQRTRCASAAGARNLPRLRITE